MKSETRAGQWHMEFVPHAWEMFGNILLMDEQVVLKYEYQCPCLGYANKI
jgi:hypothetical protein